MFSKSVKNQLNMLSQKFRVVIRKPQFVFSMVLVGIVLIALVMTILQTRQNQEIASQATGAPANFRLVLSKNQVTSNTETVKAQLYLTPNDDDVIGVEAKILVSDEKIELLNASSNDWVFKAFNKASLIDANRNNNNETAVFLLGQKRRYGGIRNLYHTGTKEILLGEINFRFKGTVANTANLVLTSGQVITRSSVKNRSQSSGSQIVQTIAFNPSGQPSATATLVPPTSTPTPVNGPGATHTPTPPNATATPTTVPTATPTVAANTVYNITAGFVRGSNVPAGDNYQISYYSNFIVLNYSEITENLFSVNVLVRKNGNPNQNLVRCISERGGQFACQLLSSEANSATCVYTDSAKRFIKCDFSVRKSATDNDFVKILTNIYNKSLHGYNFFCSNAVNNWDPAPSPANNPLYGICRNTSNWSTVIDSDGV